MPRPEAARPTPDAVDRVARLWAATDIDLPYDGTVADALRKGLQLLTRTGIDLRAEPEALLVALYLALVADDNDALDDPRCAPKRGRSACPTTHR